MPGPLRSACTRAVSLLAGRPEVGRSRTLLRLALIVLALAWLCGAIGFVRSDGSLELTLAPKGTPPTGEHNLASYRWGPRLRASSYHRDPGSHHHPLFLVDGRRDPSLIEKWASSRADRAPWIEIAWREPRALAKVVIAHAGAHEPKPNLARYSLRCLSASGSGAPLMVDHNIAAIASHPLPCARALGVRIDFALRDDEDRARVYEIEAWGQ